MVNIKVLFEGLRIADTLEREGTPESKHKAYSIYQEIFENPETPEELRKTVGQRLQSLQETLPVVTEKEKPKEVLVKSDDDFCSNMVMAEVKTIETLPFLEDLMPISQEDLTLLEDDIRDRGIMVPLTVTPQFKLVCGYNRLRIAKKLGIGVVPVEFKNIVDAEEYLKIYAIKDNLCRRQLTAGEKVKLISTLAEYPRTGRPPKVKGERLTDDEIGQAFNVSSRTVRRARKYAKAVKQTPSNEGRSIRDVLSGETEVNKKQWRKIYVIGANDDLLEKDLMDITGEIWDMDLRQDDKLTVTVVATVDRHD